MSCSTCIICNDRGLSPTLGRDDASCCIICTTSITSLYIIQTLSNTWIWWEELLHMRTTSSDFTCMYALFCTMTDHSLLMLMRRKAMIGNAHDEIKKKVGEKRENGTGRERKGKV